jgi:DNA-directed RNA polymerase specialized sigma24 family protein
MHTYTAANANHMIGERGPQWAVTGTVRRGAICVEYALDAQEADRWRETFEADHYYQVRVIPPQDSVDLAALGRELREARRVLREKTRITRAGVLRAAEEGWPEAEIARQAGVDRMTVRKWLGKR